MSLSAGVSAGIAGPVMVIAIVGAALVFVLTLCLNGHIAGHRSGIIGRNDHLVTLPVGSALAQDGVQGSAVHRDAIREGGTQAILAQSQLDGSI